MTASHRIAQEEIFGPVLSVMTFRTPEEAIERANNTPYGLSAGVWTDKGSKIFKMVSKLRAGVVWANTYNKFDPTSPFGGYKESGFGREGGLHGLLPYLSWTDCGHRLRMEVSERLAYSATRLGVEVEHHKRNPEQRPQRGVHDRAQDIAGERERIERRRFGQGFAAWSGRPPASSHGAGRRSISGISSATAKTSSTIRKSDARMAPR